MYIFSLIVLKVKTIYACVTVTVTVNLSISISISISMLIYVKKKRKRGVRLLDSLIKRTNKEPFPPLYNQ